jgi:hypothetical protein
LTLKKIGVSFISDMSTTTDLNSMKLEDEVALALKHYTDALVEWNESQTRHNDAIMAVSVAKTSGIPQNSSRFQNLEEEELRAKTKTQQARKDFETKQGELDKAEKALKKYKDSKAP